MVQFKDLDDVAIEMVNIYKDYSRTVKVTAPDGNGVTESLIDDLGLSKLADKFNEVPIGNRAGVYSIFLDRLTDLNIGVQIEQFKGPVH